MVYKIDLRPIAEEHISALRSFLDSMSVNSKIDPYKDYVREDASIGRTGELQGDNIRFSYFELEGVKIDGISYTILQASIGTGSGGPYGGSPTGESLVDDWVAGIEYWVAVDVGTDDKKREALEARIKKKHKGLPNREIVDYEWVGGRIADILNEDTSLKEPLLAHLKTAQTTQNDADIWILPAIGRPCLETTGFLGSAFVTYGREKKTEPWGILGSVIRACPTIGHGRKTAPLLIPSKDAFRAYDRIAKHIKQYAAAMQGSKAKSISFHPTRDYAL